VISGSETNRGMSLCTNTSGNCWNSVDAKDSRPFSFDGHSRAISRMKRCDCKAQIWPRLDVQISASH
jgi:hypothetical protein